MDLVTLALCKKYVQKTLEGEGALKGKDGDSIVNVAIGENGHLICTLSNSTEIDAGEMPKLESYMLWRNL